MNRVYYKVGRDGYFTRCSTFQSALRQKTEDKNYTIITKYEPVEETHAGLKPKRKMLLEQYGRVPVTKI